MIKAERFAKRDYIAEVVSNFPTHLQESFRTAYGKADRNISIPAAAYNIPDEYVAQVIVEVDQLADNLSNMQESDYG